MKRGFLLATLVVSVSVLADVDPAWLKAWQEAVASRPTELKSHSRLGEIDEPGEPLLIRGLVVTPQLAPAAGVVVHAYHRDAAGFEFGPRGDRKTTWRVQGWAVTDADGVFSFDTIRPAADHLGRDGAHIHFTLISEDLGRQWAPTVFLGDDPLVSDAKKASAAARGQFGDVQYPTDHDGRQLLEVALQLKAESDF